MGAARERGTMEPRGVNRWRLRVFLGRDAEGKRRYSSKSFEGSTVQARVALTKMLREMDTQTFVPAGKMTVEEYVDGWLAGKLGLSPRTKVSYGHQLLHVKAKLGAIRLTDLTKANVQQLVISMVEHRHLKTKKALSPRSIQYTIRILREALEEAIADGLIVRNPATRIELPAKQKRGASVLSVPQMNTLLEKTASELMGVLWRLLLTTAMRPQEAFALKWADLNLDTGSVSIRRTLVADGKGKTTLAERTKSGSDRSLGLPQSTVDALKAHKQRQAAEILKAGAKYDRIGLVFANQFGRPLDVSRVRRWWKAALKSAELPEVRLYDTRHSHLTALLQSGMGIAFVSARAGHKDIAMTVEHYAHVMPEDHQGMGAATEKMMQAGGTVTKGKP